MPALSKSDKFSPSLNVDMWQQELIDDPDAEFILDGVKHGFKLFNANIEPPISVVNNYTSATSNHRAVESQILEEIQEGRYVTMSKKPPVVSAIGAIYKPDGSVRLIHDCSRPHGSAANDYSIDYDKQRFQSIQNALDLMKPNCYMAKVDLKSAYRSVAIHPSQYKFTGLKWHFTGDKDPTYITDKFLCFGARNAPKIFHRLTQAVRRFMNKRGWTLIAFLDDFLIIADNKEDCLEAYQTLIAMLRQLGFDIAWSKVVDPTQAIVFLGVLLDSLNMSISLPQEKIVKFHNFLREFRSRARASKRQLQKLAGKLSYAAHVVISGGRIYLQRVLNLVRQLAQPHHKVKLTDDFMADIDWWLAYLSTFNCKSIVSTSRPQLHIFTDACDTGGGMIAPFDWAHINWATDMPSLQQQHSNVLETMTAFMALYRWAPRLSGYHVVIHTDNITTKAIINKGSTRNNHLMAHLRQIFWLGKMFNFTVSSSHIRGKDNIIADSLSRLDSVGHFLFIYSLMTNGAPFEMSRFLLYYQGHLSPNSLFHLSQFSLGSHFR